MDLSGIKLVVTDMDGTLLNSNHEVSGRFFHLYDQLKAQNIHFVAASGRQYNSIVSKLAPIRDQIYVIAENGGLAMFGEEEIVSTPLEKATKNTILSQLIGNTQLHPVLCARNSAYVTGSSPEFISVLREYYTEFEVIPDLMAFTEKVMKIAVYHFESSEKYIYPLVASLENSLKVKISGQHWVDISHPNAHKGFALKKVQERLGVSPAETLVFGDYNNDLEMMTLSEYSFAMANAHPNVLKAAKYQTESNEQFGVEKVLEMLLKSLN
ncbi:MAG: HAD family phosphatase [Flavobacteriales bacterium]|nr:MAG: HAD family phosphatase [Flavobacteriales bacterium]